MKLGTNTIGNLGFRAALLAAALALTTPFVAVAQGEKPADKPPAKTDITGTWQFTVKDGKIDFTFKAEVQGNTLTVTYTGTVVSNDSLKGSLSLGEVGSGTFTAKRQ